MVRTNSGGMPPDGISPPAIALFLVFVGSFLVPALTGPTSAVTPTDGPGAGARGRPETTGRVPMAGIAVGPDTALGGTAEQVHFTITGPDSVTFDWSGGDSLIHFGTTIAYGQTIQAVEPLPLPFSSPGPFREAALTGLQPDTLYHYSIGNDPDRTFRTPPPRGAAGFIVMAQGDIGDSSSYDELPGVQSIIAAEQPAFVLALGDLTYGNTHGQAVVDQHFNDMMAWSVRSAYMPAWGNHDWEPTDDLRNYKGRFDLPNDSASPGAPAISCCGEDWYWFDYGNTRFIAYPEPWSGAWEEWQQQGDALMAQAQVDPDLAFIITFGHRPAWSSGNHPGNQTLAGILADLGGRYSKFVLNVNAHSHDYERSVPISGVVHVTSGAGGSSLEQNGPCLWAITCGGLCPCPAPAWSAFRAMHLGALRLYVTPTGIEGTFICGPAGGGENDVTCAPGESIDTFTIGTITPNAPPVSIIHEPPGDMTIAAGESVHFAGGGSDPDGDLPLTYYWTFDGAAPDSGEEDPGFVTFPYAGVFTVFLTARDSLGLADPSPASRRIAVTAPDGSLTFESRIAADQNDAEEDPNGIVDLTSSDLELIDDGSPQTVGIRFPGITIEPGVTIVDAWIRFQVDEVTVGPTMLKIRAQADDDAPPFAAIVGDISSRPVTSAAASWSPPPWDVIGASGPEQRTPGIAPLVQEIIDRPGWTPGAAIAFIITGSGERTAEAYDGDPAGAPLLHIDYLPGIVENLPPDGTIDMPAGNLTVDTSQPVTFAASGMDPDGNLPLTWSWDFDGGAAPSTQEDPGPVAFTMPGSYLVTLTGTDSLGLPDPTPDSRVITVMAPVGVQTTEAISVTGEDDAEERSNGNISLGGGTLDFGETGAGPQIIGLRFAGLPLPAGAVIQEAWIGFHAQQSDSAPASLEIRAEASDDAPAFTTTRFDLSSRTTDPMVVPWSPPSWVTGESGPAQRTPDLSVLIRNWMDRPGRVSADAIVLIVSGSGSRVAASRDAGDTVAPILHLQWVDADAIIPLEHHPDAPPRPDVDTVPLTPDRASPPGP